MTHVLITGGAGSLGSALSKLCLSKGYKVSVFEIVPWHSADKLRDVIDQIHYHWKSCEDISRDDLETVDILLHTSAQAERPLGVSSPLYTIHKNTMELAMLLEACRKAKITKLIYPGSGTVMLGVAPEKQPITEETTPKPTNPYSWSKYADELLCETYRICYGVPTVILRSGLVYGGDMRRDISIAQFIIKAARNEQIIVRSPMATRTPTHIEDVLKYWDAILEKPAEEVVGQIFHSVYGKEYSVMDIVRIVVETLGSKSELVVGPYDPGEKVGGQPVRQWIISTKDDSLGVKPKIDLREGIEKTVPHLLGR